MKFFKWIALLLVVLIGLVFAAPYFFADRIREEVTKQIDQYVEADVAFGEVELTLLRNFPSLSVVVNDLSVGGQGVFDSLRLAELDEFAVAVDFWSAIGEGPIRVNAVELVRPHLHVVVLEDGTTNTDILRNVSEASETASNSESNTALQLDRYQIEDGQLIYDDRAGGTYVRLDDLDHTGSGDFTATQFELDTKTTIAELSAASGGVTYLNQAGLAYDAKLNVDTDAGSLILADNQLTLNELTLNADGSVGFPTKTGSLPIDLAFSTPEQDFRALWSVIPAVFTKDLTGLKTSGAFAVRGNVKGTYEGETGSLPGFAVDLDVTDASVQYPDLPKALTGINVKGGARSAGRDLADLLIDVERFQFALGNNPFKGSLQLRQSTTDPAFDLAAEGTLDLADLSQAVPLEDVEQLAGLIALNLTATGTASGASSDLRSIQSKGLAKIEGLVYDAVGLPKVEIRSGTARFSGSEVNLENAEILAGRSDLKVNGTLTDPFALATETGTLGGQINLRSRTLDANEWLTEPSGSVPTDPQTEPAPASRPFDRFDIGFDVEVEQLEYDVYSITDAATRGRVSSETLVLNDSRVTVEGQTLTLSGKLDNLYGFSFDDELLTGALQLTSPELDLLKLANAGVDPSATPATADEAPGEYIAMPENMSIRVATVVDKLMYDDIELKAVSGVIAMANQGAVIENGKAGVIGGTMAIDGGYQYRGPDVEPTFDLKYDIQGASFKQAFEQLNTVERLAPVAQYITGTFNTNLVMSSTLGKDMLPRLEDLDADGFINTLNATIEQFAPLATAADKLNIKELKTIELKNTKNWFTVEDGTVNVRPFDVNWSGIDATIGGSHGLDKAMDYNIIALVPRAMLGNNTVGAAANKGLDFLSGQASKLGLNLEAGEFVRVNINLTGSITDPKVGIKLLGTEGEGSAGNAAGQALKAAAQQARDSIERLAQAKLNAAKAEAEARARAVADSVRSAAEARARAAADEAKAKAKAEADRLANEAKKRAEAEAKKAAEEAKKKLGDEAKKKLKGLLGKKKGGG